MKLKLSKMLKEIRPFIKSIITDNRKKLSKHQFIADEYCIFFFACENSPCQKDFNKNLNEIVYQHIRTEKNQTILTKL
jgi:IS30 family transposase